MNVLITGGAGFVGSHLCQLLLKQGHNVTIYDKLDLRVLNPRMLQWTKGEHCRIVEGDIRDEPNLIDAMKHQDLVIHAAAQSAVDVSLKHPIPTFMTNSLGTVHVLEAMRHSGVKRLHYVSTDEVFGAATSDPFTEHSLVQPRNPYSAGKAAGESAVFAWANTYGLEVTITNGCNNYGPKQAPEKLIPRLTIRGILGKTLPIYGDGQQVREWIHVDDHARAIWQVIQHGKLGHRYCVGGVIAMNVQIVRKILENLGIDESKIEFVEDRLGHDVRYAINMAKLTGLGWKPKINLEEGLRDTIFWYRDNRQWWEYFLGQYEI